MKISFHSYRNSDYIRLLTQILLICQVYTIEILQAISLAAYYEELLARQPQVSLALDKNNKNPYTLPVADADLNRDDALDAFKYYLLYCTKQPDQAVRAAANRVIAVVQTFGWSMQQDNYSEQTKNVRSLIAEVEASAGLQADLLSCSCSPQFELIKTTQDNFEQMLNAFNVYETKQKNIDPVAEKQWLRETITTMVDDLNYHCRRKTNAECQQISNQLETVALDIASEIKARETRAEVEPETGI
ncbi:DUF6261 family protein [Mangrovibacterium lignilyticum]|uniref:DUF6261 family protein n=1 Tax=Mangrovibacterium lignilyticum TaxID=2668052 RepID=UPI0013D7EB9D|nr:DUF6261 family protein [Mangrovibacterium lignilyticum]